MKNETGATSESARSNALATWDDLSPVKKSHPLAQKFNCAGTGKIWQGTLGTTEDHTGKVAFLIKNAEHEISNVLLLDTKDEINEFVEMSYLPTSLGGCYVRFEGVSDHVLVTSSPMAAMSLNQATRYNVVCTLNPHNTADVLKHLSAKFPATTFVLCEDMPIGLRSATEGHSFWAKVIHLPTPKLGFYQKALNEPLGFKQRIKGLLEEYEKNQREATEAPEQVIHGGSRKVNGVTLYQQVAGVINDHVSLQPEMLPILTMYIYLTHLASHLKYVPLLGILSPEPRCGKTTLMEILEALVYSPKKTDNITVAALCKFTEMGHTILIDEFDTFCDKSKEFIGIINSGVRKSGTCTRYGRNGQAIESPTFGAKIYAMIGTPPQTILDRSISILQQRKLATEVKKSLEQTGSLGYLKHDIELWCKANLKAIISSREKVPKIQAANDRQADNYHILARIAACISPEIEVAVRASASLLISALQQQENSHSGEKLMQDIKVTFEDANVGKMSSKEMIQRLCRLPDSVWGSYKSNRPIEAHQLAQILKLFKISPTTIRFGGEGVSKGYRKDMFEDAFSRYCTSAASSN
jgi:Protein of unknown function (DUF3631)